MIGPRFKIQENRINRVKDILLGLVGLVVAQYVVIGAAAFYYTRDLVKYADEFFVAVKANNMEKAYDYLSEDLQSNVGQTELGSYLNQISATDIQKTNWKSRFKENDQQGAVEGGITTDAGDVVPIRVNFVKGGNGWKISSIEQFVPARHND